MSSNQFAKVEELVSALGNADDAARWNAHQSLVEMGTVAIPHLVRSLQDSRILVRWEITQILATLQDPSAASALVEALGDDDSGVRWSAVRALMVLREQAIVPLLQGLMHSKSNLIFDNAHHVLRNIPLPPETRAMLEPVMNALSGMAPELQAPIAARELLTTLQP